jgi:hypothetical protein
MPLRPEGSALWTNPAWRAGDEPGTFAVVIGISSYQHLNGGQQPAADCYGLGQLNVSALTAYRFFQWLESEYRYPAAPLAHCWLLLSPNEAEKSFEPALPQTPAPTLDECRLAIQSWFAKMQELSPGDAEKSRAIFFFSGHGLEIATDRQVLLPCDYLRPPLAVLGDALSTHNLYAGLRKLPVPEQLFLLDACRNDHPTLRQLELRGASVFDEWPAYMANPGLIAPLVYATASGSQAWEPKRPQDGVSLFGKALLEGLRAQGSMLPDCSGGPGQPCKVQLFDLAPFLAKRLQELHFANGSRVQQPVRISGSVADLLLTEVDARVDDPAAKVPLPSAAVAWASVVLPGGEIEPKGGTADPLREVFGGEGLSEMWEQAELYDLKSGEQIPDRGRRFTILKATASEDGEAFKVWVRVDRSGPHWLQLRYRETTFGVCLPGDAHALPQYVFELERLTAAAPDGTSRSTIRLDVDLGEADDQLLNDAVRLWARYRRADLSKTVEADDLKQLVSLVQEKLDSPLAAVVAALLLFRTARTSLPRQWLRNLVEVSDLPDCPVLLAEHLLRDLTNAAGYLVRTSVETPQRAPYVQEIDARAAQEITDAVLKLEQRGLPLTADALTLAARQISDLLTFGTPPSHPDRARFERLQARVMRALAHLRPGGLFAVFAGDDITCELVRPSAQPLSPVDTGPGTAPQAAAVPAATKATAWNSLNPALIFIAVVLTVILGVLIHERLTRNTITLTLEEYNDKLAEKRKEVARTSEPKPGRRQEEEARSRLEAELGEIEIDTEFWPNGLVPYEIGSNFIARDKLSQAIAMLETNTNVRLVSRTPANADKYPNYVQVVGGNGCSSYVGMRQGAQKLTLGPECEVGSMLHELGHTLGLYHEHNRPDRDKYVRIFWENLEPTFTHNFNIVRTAVNMKRPYDYESIMHFPPMAFSTNGKATIEALLPNIAIGARDKLSAGDTLLINALYPTVPTGY